MANCITPKLLDAINSLDIKQILKVEKPGH